MSGIIGGAGSKSGVIGTTELDYEEGIWTLTASNLTIGNGSTGGTYTRIGNIVHVWGFFKFGSTSSIGGTMTSISTLPFSNASANPAYVSINFRDNLNLDFAGFGRIESGSTSIAYPQRITTTSWTPVTTTTPMTWTTSDMLTLSATYNI